MRKSLILLTLGLNSALIAQPLQVDAELPSYKKTKSVAGNLNSIGSDTMNNLMTLWAEEFRKFHPGVTVQVEGKGSSTAPPALIAGTAQLGPMSRDMKRSEIEKIKSKYGYAPTELRTSLDALAVFVHKDNPLAGISLKEVDAVMSKTRKRGNPESIDTWGKLGLTGDYAGKAFQLYGRNSASGTYGFFKDVALNKGDFKDQVKEQPGSSSVVSSIGVDKYAIGYSGIGYLTSGVKPLPVSVEPGEKFVDASYANVLDGSYPLARYLFVYILKDPRKPLDDLTTEFVKFVFSKEGQKVVIKDGYLPVTAKVATEELAKIK